MQLSKSTHFETDSTSGLRAQTQQEGGSRAVRKRKQRNHEETGKENPGKCRKAGKAKVDDWVL